MKKNFLLLLLMFLNIINLYAIDDLPNIKFVNTLNNVIFRPVLNTIQLGDTLIYINEIFKSDKSSDLTLNLLYGNKCDIYTLEDLGLTDRFDIFLKCAIYDNDNNLLLGLEAGFFKLKDNKFEFYDFPSKGINAFVKDKDGNIWFNDYYAGIAMITGDTIQRFPLNETNYYLGPALHPLSSATNLIYMNDTIYYQNLKGGLGCFDIKNKKFDSLKIINIIDSLYVGNMDRNKRVPLKIIFRSLSKDNNKLRFLVEALPRNVYYYDGTNLEVDSSINENITKKYFLDYYCFLDYYEKDAMNRSWIRIYLQNRTDTLDKFYKIFMIDKDKINYLNLGKISDTLRPIIGGIWNPPNKLNQTYIILSDRGAIIEDTTGSSIIETNNPSFFIQNIAPNPFSDRTTIELLAEQGAINNIKLEIFDYLGKSIRKVEPFINYYPKTGVAKLDIETEGIPSGYYYLVIKDGNDTRTKPILIK